MDDLENRQASSVIRSKEEFEKIFAEDFSTGARQVYINSLGRSFAFRDITAEEQKSLSKMLIGNEGNRGLVFDAQCALINRSCLDSGFDIFKVSEFDRLKLMLAMYQSNYIQQEAKFKCQECGADNSYKIDFEDTLKELDGFDISPKEFYFETRQYKFNFKVSYPLVSLVSEFYNSSKNKKQSAGNASMMLDYVNLFIESVDLENKANGRLTSIDFRSFPVSEIEPVFGKFPQEVIYSENGVLSFVANNLIGPVNGTFKKPKCAQCGAEQEKEGIQNSESFF